MTPRRTLVPLLVVPLSVAMLAGCSSSGATITGSPSGSAALSAPAASGSQPVTSPSDTRSPDDTASAAPVAINPCAVVTQQEAATLAGHDFTRGRKGPLGSGPGVQCTYGAGATGLVWVHVVPAESADAAQAEWQHQENRALAEIAKGLPAEIEQPKLGEVQGIGDRAAVGSGSTTIEGQKLSLSVIYVLKGPIFLAIGDIELNRPAATPDALADQAQTSLGRI